MGQVNSESPWLYRVLIAIDQLLATIFLPKNNPDCTISDWAWRNKKTRLIAFIDWLFSWYEKDHCKNSFEGDEK